MPQPPTTPIIAHDAVRAIPIAAQRTELTAALANGASLVAEWDVAKRITDPNQLLAGAFPGGGAAPALAIGPNLDALWFSDQAGLVTVAFAVDQGGAYRNLFQSIVAANVPGNISGLRITGRFVRVTYLNNSGVAALVEFGVYVRST